MSWSWGGVADLTTSFQPNEGKDDLQTGENK